MQRRDGLLDRRAIVEAMDLVEIDIIHPQAAQGIVDGMHHMLARQPALIGRRPHGLAQLGRHHDMLAVGGKFLQCPAGDFLAHAQRIDIGGVEEIDPRVQGAHVKGIALAFLQHPVTPLRRPIGHGPQADFRDFQARGAQTNHIHCRFPADKRPC
jgi:hypothetical protein